MSGNTPIANLPYPDPTDPPNGPQATTNLALALEHEVSPSYASAAAQTTANPSPQDGDQWYRSDIHQGFLNKNGTVVPRSDSFSKLFSQTLSVAGTFNIPSTALSSSFNTLRIYVVGGSVGSNVNGFNDISLQFNNDTANHYSRHLNYTLNSSTDSVGIFDSVSFLTGGFLPSSVGDITSGEQVGVATIEIPLYNVPNMAKSILFNAHGSSGVGAPNNKQFGTGGGIWATGSGSTPAITSIQITVSASPNTFSANSYCAVYGLA